jgi:hypothetical protein
MKPKLIVIFAAFFFSALPCFSQIPNQIDSAEIMTLSEAAKIARKAYLEKGKKKKSFLYLTQK